MRPDMSNLLVERGHAGTGYTRHQPKGWTARCRFRGTEDDADEAWLPPHRQPHFSENLQPLRRYLAAQVGRPWNKVYAEIRARIDTSNAVQFHILEHLYDDLAVVVWEGADGRLWCNGRWRRHQPIDEPWGPDLYVCPRTGILRRVRRRREDAKPKPLTQLPGSGPDHDHRLLAGQWYEVWWGTSDQPPHDRAIIRKRQLSRWELKNLGLRD